MLSERSKPADHVAESVGPPVRKIVSFGSVGLRDAAISLSLANLCLLNTWRSTIFNRHHEYFFQIPNYAPRYAASLLNLLLLAVTFWLAIFFARKSKKGVCLDLVKVVFLMVLLVPLNFVRKFVLDWSVNEVLHFGTPAITAALALSTIVLTIRFHRRVAAFAAVTVLMLVPFCAVTMVRTSWFLSKSTWKPNADEKQLPPMRETQRANEPRLLWIIFDELDQRVAFEKRNSGIELPNLNRFCNGALVATNAFPPAGTTLLSIPALTTGRLVAEAIPVSLSQMSLRFAGDGRLVKWSEAENVFSRARADGFNTAIVGWYHPYPRVFGRNLNAAEWSAIPSIDAFGGGNISHCVATQLLIDFWPFYEMRLFTKLYADSVLRCARLVTNSAFGLTLLHLSIPHTPVVHESIGGHIASVFAHPGGADYLNNLYWVDVTFGQLRLAMEQMELWDKTTVLVSSDHWWRTSKQLDRITDHRVPFILKLANSIEPIVYRKQFNTVISADLITAVLKKEIQNTSEICSWLDQHESSGQYAYAPDGSLMKSGF